VGVEKNNTLNSATSAPLSDHTGIALWRLGVGAEVLNQKFFSFLENLSYFISTTI
jgi:hypothetical protein